MSLLIKKTIKSMLLNQRQSYRTICDFIFIILIDSLLATKLLFMHGPQFISFCLIFLLCDRESSAFRACALNFGGSPLKLRLLSMRI